MMWRRSTNRGFTVVVCTQCESDHVLPVLAALGSVVTRCPHGMVVRANCLLGLLTCASRPTGGGVMVVLQPCSLERIPTGPAIWLGPADSPEDVSALSDFVERGLWEFDELPDRLRAHRERAADAGRMN